MFCDTPTQKQLRAIYAGLAARAVEHGGPVCVKYLQLGTQTVRVVCCAADFIPHMEAQWAYILRDDAPACDATIVVWQEREFTRLAQYAATCDRTSAAYRQWRLDKMRGAARPVTDLTLVDPAFHHRQPVVEICSGDKSVRAWDPANRVFYYAVRDFAPEEFIKRGHLCVHALACILKRPQRNLGHGAVVGLDGHGALICGMGYRGKSTLSVAALLDGFEYVTDDYILLDKSDGTLRAWPIYSIITLGPAVYQTLSPRMDARFVSNNGRKDKYVFSIARYHERFATAYPIECCLFPRFTGGSEPRIEPGDRVIATDEFALSTVNQTGEAQDMRLIAKLCGFVDDLPCFRFNLTTDFFKNTRCLREFLEQRRHLNH
ncbi:hypothetical protein [Desulfovibrio sp. ZJ200]|uniref:hypothetical protein n=1 Tax=Desulfovibrio sp. ZJ200 TaxID=2709792 RepID=UPI0013EDF524|nr:hypothetical protein [Desulfovibrio sp. ZJ200]